MANDSRSPNSCPWDPGEVCKASNGACLPPHKRLLAGLKQNGWLPSSSPYLQSCNGAPCAGLMEELKLEVDLEEANHECNGDTCLVESSAYKQGDCNAAEISGFVKSNKASERRKRLSVLADCHSSANNLQPEVLISCPRSKIQKKFRSNKASMESLLASNEEKESVSSYREMVENQKKFRSNKASMDSLLASNEEKELASSYREMVDAARARAAKAAKDAAEAKAIAVDKAAAAAKAATAAKAALEAVALAVYDGEWESQFSNHVPAARRQRRKQDLEPKAFVPLLLNGSVSDVSEKTKGDERTQIGSAGLDKSKEDERTQVGQASAVALSSVGVGALLDKIKVDGQTQAGQNPIINLATARAGAHLDKNKEDEQTCFNQICTAACPSPPPPPVDDEKLARQLHRAMNSSPRISRNQAPSECLKKSETSPSSTQSCIRHKYQCAGGRSFSREKKRIPKVKLHVLRTSIRRADVKVKSICAINETLNLLQGASCSQYRVYGGTVSCCAASDEHGDKICAKEGASMPMISSHAFASWTKCNEESNKLTVNCDGARSCRFDAEAKSSNAHFSSYIHEPDVIGMDDESIAMGSARVIKKLKFSSKQRTESC